jgi:hypothetical protein
MIFSEIMKAIGYLFFAVIIVYIYNQAVQSKHDWKKILGQGFLWCAGGAFVLALMLGRPTCIDREEDGRGGIVWSTQMMVLTPPMSSTSRSSHFTLPSHLYLS